MVKNLDKIINNLTKNFNNVEEHQILKILNCEMSDYFNNKLEEINYIFGQQQIEIYLIH